MTILLVLLLSRAAPAETPAPAPAPTARPAATLSRAPVMARPKTLSDHAAEMKAKGETQRAVSFDDVRKGTPAAPRTDVARGDDAAERRPGASPAATLEESKAADAAQKRMDRAVESGLAVPERTSASRRNKARREWDEAAEACRRTPGCVPRYRDDAAWGENRPLKTDEELIEDLRKRGFSEPHPTPR